MSLNYTKLYFVILAAILSAFFYYCFFFFNLSVQYALNDLEKRFSFFFPSRTTLSAPQHSPTLQRDLNKLSQLAAPQPKTELTTEERQKKAAKENDVILCKFWTDQYKKR